MNKTLTKQMLFELFSTQKKLISDNLLKTVMEELENSDFPTLKDEDWRKTDLKFLLNHNFELPTLNECPENIISNYNISGSNSINIVFYNGFFQKKLSNITSSESIEIAKIDSEHNDLIGSSNIHKISFFTKINSVYSTEGMIVRIKKNTEIQTPIHIYNFADGNNRKTAFLQRNIIAAEQGSKAKISMSFHALSNDVFFSNIATEIFLEPNSIIDLNIFEGEGNNAFLFNAVKVIQQRDSQFSSHTYTLCGKLVRNDLHIDIEGENATTEVNGLYLPDREQHVDNNVLINHKVGNSYSSQFYRGILDNNATAVFTGKVHIFKNASKTNAFQKNNNIILSQHAKVHSKPQLIIENDDVVASHGSTVGQLDKEAIFYMQARGISKETAKTLMLIAFANEITEKINNKEFKHYINFYLDRRLKGLKQDGLCSKMGICRG